MRILAYAHLAGQEHTIGRLREYQRALLWCYGWVNRAFESELTAQELADSIDDAEWLKVKRLVGEASEEVKP